MAPLYDNGSSLGCFFEKKGLLKAFDEHGNVKESHILTEMENGRHHLRLKKPASTGAKFEDLCNSFLEAYPEGIKWFQEAASTKTELVGNLLTFAQSNVKLPEPYALCDHRKLHICAMIDMGKKRLRRVIDG